MRSDTGLFAGGPMRELSDMEQGALDNMLSKRPLRKFKLNPKYPHHRSEGLTHRTNKGTALQVRRHV